MSRRRTPTVRSVTDRGGALLEDAAEITRLSARTRVGRLKTGGRSILQMAIAATIAWFVATELIGNAQPFFAPVAAIVTLGIAYGKRTRRAIELALGVATGILVSDLLVAVLGHGTLVLGLVVLLAVTAAVLVGSGPVIVNQAGVSAVLVVTIQPPGAGFVFDRFFDALAGGAVALAVSALILPVDPLTIVRKALVPILDELAATLDDIAAAVRLRDLAAAEAALERARGVDVLGMRLHEAVDVGRETARIAPVRRRAREQVALYAEADAQIDLALRNVRVLARGATRGIRFDDSMPEAIVGAICDLAIAVRGLEHVIEHPDDADRVREPALRAAATATWVLERTGNLSISVIVGQVRSTAVDLLRGSGLDSAEAAEAIRHASREAERAAISLD